MSVAMAVCLTTSESMASPRSQLLCCLWLAGILSSWL